MQASSTDGWELFLLLLSVMQCFFYVFFLEKEFMDLVNDAVITEMLRKHKGNTKHESDWDK